MKKVKTYLNVFLLWLMAFTNVLSFYNLRLSCFVQQQKIFYKQNWFIHSIQYEGSQRGIGDLPFFTSLFYLKFRIEKVLTNIF